MIKKDYENFNDLFYGINKDIIEHPVEYVQTYFSKKQFYIDYLVLNAKNCDFNINIGDLYYTEKKWETLKKWYIDEDRLFNFKKAIKENDDKSMVFYFKEKRELVKNLNVLCNKENCLIAMVLNKYRLTEKKYVVTVYYRTTELNRAFALDLILINKIIKYLGIETQCINIVIPAPYINPSKLILQSSVFGFNLNEIMEDQLNPLGKVIREYMDIVEADKVEEVKWITLRNILKKYNKETKYINFENLKLMEEM